MSSNKTRQEINRGLQLHYANHNRFSIDTGTPNIKTRQPIVLAKRSHDIEMWADPTYTHSRINTQRLYTPIELTTTRLYEDLPITNDPVDYNNKTQTGENIFMFRTRGQASPQEISYPSTFGKNIYYI